MFNVERENYERTQTGTAAAAAGRIETKRNRTQRATAANWCAACYLPETVAAADAASAHLHTQTQMRMLACLLITVFENSKSPSAAAASAAEKAEWAESINNNKSNKRCDKVQHVACATQFLPHTVGVQSTHAPRSRQQQFIMTSGVLRVSTQRATWRLFRLSKYPAKSTVAKVGILDLNACISKLFLQEI